MEEKKNCPNCGQEMILGWMRVYASRGASLFWESEDKYPQKSINPFRLGKMIPKKYSKLLMRYYSFFCPENQEKGWYCPDCGQVFACFKVAKKDVSP